MKFSTFLGFLQLCKLRVARNRKSCCYKYFVCLFCICAVFLCKHTTELEVLTLFNQLRALLSFLLSSSFVCTELFICSWSIRDHSCCIFNHLYLQSLTIFSCPRPSRSVVSCTASLRPFGVLHGQQTSETRRCPVHLTAISIPSLLHWRSKRMMAKATTSTWSHVQKHTCISPLFITGLSGWQRCCSPAKSIKLIILNHLVTRRDQFSFSCCHLVSEMGWSEETEQRTCNVLSITLREKIRKTSLQMALTWALLHMQSSGLV